MLEPEEQRQEREQGERRMFYMKVFSAKGGGAGFMWNAPYCLVGSVRQLNLYSPLLIVNSCVQRRSGPPGLEIPETERGRGAPRYYAVHAIRPSEDNLEKSDQWDT